MPVPFMEVFEAAYLLHKHRTLPFAFRFFNIRYTVVHPRDSSSPHGLKKVQICSVDALTLGNTGDG